MKFLYLLLPMLYLLNAHASKEYSRSWFGLMGKKQLTSEYSLWSEFQLRYDNNITTMQQSLIRFGILKKLDKNEIGLLAGYIQTGITKEYRPTLQHSYSFSSNPNRAFSMRNRLEARIVEDNSDFSLRYRGLLRYQGAIEGPYSLVIWDEPFLNLTDDSWTGNRVFERNRFFIGPRFSFSYTQLEVGYMNQFIPRREGNSMEHIIVAYMFY